MFGGGDAGPSSGAASNARREEAMHEAIFCLLARYEALGGHGYQAALPEACFGVLREHFECTFECFSSPLNSHFARFCSAFPDVDAAFGSCGSFFDQAFEEGSYEVNPVFVPEVLDAAVQHVLALLRASARPLSFTLIVPAWPETRAFATLHGDASADVRRWSLRLPQPAHGYCDGGWGTVRRRQPGD